MGSHALRKNLVPVDTASYSLFWLLWQVIHYPACLLYHFHWDPKPLPTCPGAPAQQHCLPPSTVHTHARRKVAGYGFRHAHEGLKAWAAYQAHHTHLRTHTPPRFYTYTICHTTPRCYRTHCTATQRTTATPQTARAAAARATTYATRRMALTHMPAVAYRPTPCMGMFIVWASRTSPPSYSSACCV